MKKIFLTICTVTILLFACNNEKKADEKAAEGSKEDSTATAQPYDTTGMTKAWQDFMTPGEMHRWLAGFNGTWDADVIGFSNPEKPDTSKATNVYSMALNGLYQEGKLAGTMMGMPFEGRSTTGYDNSKKVFVSTWVDNLGSGIIVMKGTYDAASKTLNLKGVQTDPLTSKDSDIREAMKIIDDNTYVLEMYGTGMDGKETKFMEATFKRRK